MGTSYTPKYRVETFGVGRMSWNIKSYGLPTETNLRKWRNELELSSLPGGVNAYAGEIKVGPCTIINQFTGYAVCTIA